MINISHCLIHVAFNLPENRGRIPKAPVRSPFKTCLTNSTHWKKKIYIVMRQFMEIEAVVTVGKIPYGAEEGSSESEVEYFQGR